MPSHVRLPVLESLPQPVMDDENLPEKAAKTDDISVTDLGEASKGLLQVGDIARDAGKTVRAIHLYEELNLLRPVGRSKGRYRLYGADAVTRVRWIGKLQDMGFSLSDIKTIVRDWEESGSAPRAMVKMREVYKKKLDETREALRRMKALEGELARSLDYLDTCDVCEPSRLLSACGACEHHDCNAEVPHLVLGFRHHHDTDKHDAQNQQQKKV